MGLFGYKGVACKFRFGNLPRERARCLVDFGRVRFFKFWVFLFCEVFLVAFLCSQHVRAEVASREDSLYLRILSDGYLSSSALKDGSSTYSVVGLDYSLRSRQGRRVFLLHAWGQQSMDESREQQFTLPEAYAGWTTESKVFHFGFGRKIETWSALDHEWKMGLWGPLFNWDPLRPQEQGLAGFFSKIKLSNWEVTFFGSPLFFPDQGPQFALNEGSFESHSRWFSPPQERIEVFQKESDIYYKLQKPRTEEIVLQPSWAMRLLYGDPGEGFWGQWSISYKPMNQLHLGVEAFRSIALQESFGSTVAVIHAGTVNHQLNTLEVGRTWNGAKLWLSASEETPGSSDMNPVWEQPPLFESRVFGAHLSHPLPLPMLSASHLSWNYVQTEERRQVGTQGADGAGGVLLAGESEDRFSQRFPLQRGVGLKWEAKLSETVARRVGWETQYVYSFPDRAAWFSASAKWGVSSQLTLVAGIDVLGASPSDSGKILEKSTFSRFRQNDRIGGGLTYVF